MAGRGSPYRSRGEIPLEYSPTPVPSEIGINLLDWLRREYQYVAEALRNRWDMLVNAVEPDRPRRGMIRYADGDNWDPRTGSGPYHYDGNRWIPMFYDPVLGQMLSTVPVDTGDVSGTIGTGEWYDIAGFEAVGETRGLDMDIDTGIITFDEPGVYMLTFTGTLNHVATGADRTIHIRTYLLDGDVAGDGQLVPTARNVEYTYILNIIQVPVLEAGMQIKLQVGDPSADYDSCQWVQMLINAWRISP